MTKAEMTATVLAAKAKKKLTWDELAASVGKAPEWVASCCHGMNSMPAEAANRICETLALSPDVAAALAEFPHKSWDKTIPTDPLIYRFYEIVGVYGETLKSVIHEKFGDGIMSAIDFSMKVERQEDPKGDRVVVTLNGKFLPYKSW